VDILAAAMCQGKELPGHFDENALMKARLLLSGLIAAYVLTPGNTESNLGAVSELLGGPRLFAFCRAAMKLQLPYVRARLAAFSLPQAETSREPNAIRATAAMVMNANLRTGKAAR
jgi:hypothetical protein